MLSVIASSTSLWGCLKGIKESPVTFPPFLIKTCVVNEAGLSGVLLLLDAGGVGRVASASPNELFEFILCRRYEDIGYVGVDE